MKGRTSAAEKGRTLLTEGRLIVVRIEGELIVATCRGDSGEVYNLGHDPRRAPHWRCTCKEMKGRCSHLTALQLVTAIQRGGESHGQHRAA